MIIKKLLDNVNLPSDLKSLSIKQLKQLSHELRDEIISITSKTGGHLGAGLGVIELTIALHYVFDTPNDLLVWDIGHQAYPHKYLTGRKTLLPSIRSGDGLSGFLKRSESIYDVFGAGHSSTSISAALGLAVARDINYEKHNVIAVIGDGSMSAGMAYEAMNNAANLKNKMIVILNDNKMSIAPAVGGMSQYLCRLTSSRSYLKTKNFAKTLLKKMPSRFENFFRRTERYAKNAITGGNFFEEMGFNYIGPMDGHDLDHLVSILSNIKDVNKSSKPILLHVITEKGRGFNSSEKCSEGYHAVSKYDLKTKIQQKSKSNAITYTQFFANQLVDIALQDSNVVAITAAMPSGTGLNIFAKKFPDRVYDVGIAEQHAVTFAAGLTLNKIKPYVAIYSTFLQRAYDQIVHDVAIQSLPVRFMIDRAGLVGSDGPTHAGTFDIAFLCNLPNFIVMAPSDELELARAMWTSYHINDKPSALRFPRCEVTGMDIPSKIEPYQIGKGKIIQNGEIVAVLSLGTRMIEVKYAADEIYKLYGFKITVADAVFAKPLDFDLIRELAINHELLITIEEGVIGGFGSHVSQLLNNENAFQNQKLKFRSMVLPDYFINHNDIKSMYQEANLDSAAIVKTISSILNLHIKHAT